MARHPGASPIKVESQITESRSIRAPDGSSDSQTKVRGRVKVTIRPVNLPATNWCERLWLNSRFQISQQIGAKPCFKDYPKVFRAFLGQIP